MLYMVNKSPLMFGNLKSALAIAPPGEPILLIEDGVYAAASRDLVEQALSAHPVYAIEADLHARGIHDPVAEVQVIDYDGFVELVEQHDVVPWL